jgi:ribulose-phosphate 3-epimerase
MKPAPTWFDELPNDRLLAEFSLWSADLMKMADDISRVDEFVDLYHMDVADGHFSPMLLLFPDQLSAIRELTAKPCHVHLMVTDDILFEQIDQFAEAGADLISIHAENEVRQEGLLHIEAKGVKTGIVAQLDTQIEHLRPLVSKVDMLTLLGTRIGVKGQSLNHQATDRLRSARALIDEVAGTRRVILAADGGIRVHTVPQLRAAGAETIVMGSLAFNDPDLPTRMAWVHGQRTSER